MKTKRLYRKGRRIRTIAVLAKELDARRYVFLRNRPCHPGWLQAMTYETLRAFINGRSLRKAVHVNKEEVTA